MLKHVGSPMFVLGTWYNDGVGKCKREMEMDKQAVLQMVTALRNLLAMAAPKDAANWWETIYRLDQVIEAVQHLIDGAHHAETRSHPRG